MRSPVVPWIVDSPLQCDVRQRGPDGRADIAVRVFDRARRRYRAEIHGVAEAELSRGDRDMSSGVLGGVPAGDHRLLVHGEDVTKAIDLIGVGDVHGAIGQSHTSGRSWTFFRSRDGRTSDPTNQNDACCSLARDADKLGGDHDPEGQALGSWFPLLADRLTEMWSAPQRFLNHAIGGSHTSQWQPGSPGLKRAVNAFENAGVRYVMVSIGATDAFEGASVSELKARIGSIVRELQRLRFIVLLARMPPGRRRDWAKAMAIQQEAAVELWRELPGLFPGADLAVLDPELHINRVDGVHLNAAGYREAARLWAEAYRALPVPSGARG